MNGHRELLDVVLAPGGIRSVLQPIFDMGEGQRRMAAVECLSRGPRGTNLEMPNILFEYVRLKKEEATVDRTCSVAGLMAAATLPSDLNIDINVHASTLSRDQDFAEFLQGAAEACGIEPSRVVVEIVEHSPYWDGPSFTHTLEELRRAGIAIALDDVGIGFSNYKMMIDARPEYLKIDRYLVHGCSRDAYRRAILASIQSFGSSVGARVVAEGVEEPEDLRTLLGMGIHYIQGFLLSRGRTAAELTQIGLFTPEIHQFRPSPSLVLC